MGLNLQHGNSCLFTGTLTNESKYIKPWAPREQMKFCCHLLTSNAVAPSQSTCVLKRVFKQ